MKHLFLTSDFQYVSHKIGLKLGDLANKKVVYIVTALRDKERGEIPWHAANKQKILEAGFTYDEYDISQKTEQDIRRDLAGYGVMYVEGGNPFYLLAAAKQNNFANYLKERLEQGIVYISMSAGSVVAGVDTSSAERPGHSAKEYEITTEGFCLVNFVIKPHWGKENKRFDYKQYKVPQSYNENYPYIFLTDNQYIEIEDNNFKIVDLGDK